MIGALPRDGVMSPAMATREALPRACLAIGSDDHGWRFRHDDRGESPALADPVLLVVKI